MTIAQNHEHLSQLRAEVLAIEAAMQEAARDALLAHQRAGQPVVIWENGRVVWIPAEQISVADGPPAKLSP